MVGVSAKSSLVAATQSPVRVSEAADVDVAGLYVEL